MTNIGDTTKEMQCLTVSYMHHFFLFAFYVRMICLKGVSTDQKSFHFDGEYNNNNNNNNNNTIMF